MAFKFETANERWKWFKKSVDEKGNFSWDEVEDGLRSELWNTMECYGCGKRGGYDVFDIPPTCPDCGSHEVWSVKFDDKQSGKKKEKKKPRGEVGSDLYFPRYPVGENKPGQPDWAKILLENESLESVNKKKKKEAVKTAGDLIQFPGAGQPNQEPDKQAQIEFYNHCSQLIKQVKDMYDDPRYGSLSMEQKDRLWEKASHFIWNSGINFTP